MNSHTHKNNIETFFEHFNVKVEKLALSYMYYEPEINGFMYTAPDSFGYDVCVHVEIRDENSAVTPFLVLESIDSEELIRELAQVFALTDYNVKNFINATQKNYRLHNKTSMKVED